MLPNLRLRAAILLFKAFIRLGYRLEPLRHEVERPMHLSLLPPPTNDDLRTAAVVILDADDLSTACCFLPDDAAKSKLRLDAARWLVAFGFAADARDHYLLAELAARPTAIVARLLLTDQAVAASLTDADYATCLGLVYEQSSQPTSS